MLRGVWGRVLLDLAEFRALPSNMGRMYVFITSEAVSGLMCLFSLEFRDFKFLRRGVADAFLESRLVEGSFFSWNCILWGTGVELFVTGMVESSDLGDKHNRPLSDFSITKMKQAPSPCSIYIRHQPSETLDLICVGGSYCKNVPNNPKHRLWQIEAILSKAY